MTKKWDEANMKVVGVNLRKEEAEKFEQACANLGVSKSEVLRGCVRSVIRENGAGTPAEAANAEGEKRVGGIAEEADRFRRLCANRRYSKNEALRRCVRDVTEEHNVSYALKPENAESVMVDGDLMQKVKHECGFANPRGLNPAEMVNWIIAYYFRQVEELRGEETDFSANFFWKAPKVKR